MQTGDASDFIDFGTLAEEIKSLHLALPEDLFFIFCMNKMYMCFFPCRRKNEREEEGERVSAHPHQVFGQGLYRVRLASLLS